MNNKKRIWIALVFWFNPNICINIKHFDKRDECVCVYICVAGGIYFLFGYELKY